MAIVQRPFLRRNFTQYQYAVVDSSETSPDFFDISFFPTKIGGGKSVIKFKGNPNNLALLKEVEIEVVDAAGNPVKSEVVELVDRFNNYFASINVHDDTAAGTGYVYLVGVANKNSTGQPLDRSSYNELGYNLIWGRPIDIQPFERNDSELIFNEAPAIQVAQIIAPARISSNLVAESLFTATTSSNATITTSKFRGFDKKQSTSVQVVDKKLNSIKIQPDTQATTTNIVDTTIRTANPDVIGGYQANDLERFNTVATTAVSFFSSSHVGGYMQFFTQSYTLQPSLPSTSLLATTNPYNSFEVNGLTQSIDDQLGYWKSTVVRVLNDKTAYLETPVQVNTRVPGRLGYVQNTHTYSNVSQFTASLIYVDNSSLYITSSLMSQSYIQVTCYDLKPIAGEVTRIKTYFKRSSATQDWTLLGDQEVYPPEYLTDAEKPNQASYARTLSDFLLIGHFTDNAVLQDNWSFINETPTGFDNATGSIVNNPLQDSVRLQTSGSTNKILTTKYNQSYLESQVYTIAFDCVLDPYTDLEVYMNSDVLSTTLISQDFLPKAYTKSKNKELTRYPDGYSRFGRSIGRIANATDQQKQYGRVLFDFLTDGDGLGKPLLRCVPNGDVTGSSYISKVNLTPRKLNGYTPELIQFALPAPPDFSYNLSESIDYKFEYYDYSGKQSEFISYIKDENLELVSEIQTNKCQAERKSFSFTSDYWISSSYTIPNYIVSGRTLEQITSESYSADTRLYPMFVNGAVGSILGSYAGAAASNTPVDGWNCAIPYNYMFSNSVTYSSFRYISASISTTNMTVYQNAAGRVTSSWRWFDTFTDLYNTGPGIGTALQAYAYTTASISAIDNARFTTHSCVGIRRDDVSQSYADYTNAASNTARTVALKKRRLVWPTGGSVTSSYFTENGGIYNVKFKLKKDTDYLPDTGSYLMVYLFNAYTDYTTSSIGTAGWYPPSRNIVKIGHGYTSGSITTPTITWYDSATGYYYDEYDINLIQYGSSAQLVFEPSGDGGKYFGTLVDDIEFCKVGVTTDPLFIKPQSAANLSRFGNIAFIPSPDTPSGQK